MAHIITGHDEAFAQWAAERIPNIESPERFGSYRAVGVATGKERHDRILAACVYHDFQPEYGHCQISFAAANPRWASRATIRALLSVPFLQYGCNKVWTAIPHTSERVVAFNRAIGFTREAALKDHFGKGVSAIICRMMFKDFERLYMARIDARAA